MRTLIQILLVLMVALILNIVWYSISEDYRFFLKKLKYREEVVYDTPSQVDDIDRIQIIDSTQEQVLENDAIQTTGTGFTFLDALSGEQKPNSEEEDILPELSPEEQNFLELFETQEFKEISLHSSLFWLTTEYPDPYYEFESNDLTLYIFPTKNYSELKNIFTVLKFDLPFELNETNSFWEKSFFINLSSSFTDDTVRIVLEHEKKLFWLKIKKDSYNTIKQVLLSLKNQ